MHSDTAYESSQRARFTKAVDAKLDAMTVYIKQNPGSFLSLAALSEIAGPNPDPAKIEPLFKSLSPQLQNNTSGQQLAKTIATAKVTAIGAMAPVFTQNDVNDKPVSLTDLRGKYVLIDFWASWCGPCRAENPNVVKAYEKYKDKNFTVLGVSLDQPGKKDAWMSAIKADGLTWTEVSDLQFWQNTVARQYGVLAIPQNFLVDPSGKIIGKNLRGDDLYKKLASLFN
ncbi:peroxiredoxin family protein [Mucilaginibacter polytrichastri]|uniref:Thioredoxin domain-containing protein n=1 Tax=Mucilaginibacter polytrichastri TaxID=1302689 RepID=A0A1Q6A454_9SPHI|nr:TlpA disulfide reductase family protein [Mucilaginibacter polytrichastri]OKS88777.1 hypothetical protein RG47T_4255 [Mucilaginibacter polytrichastri]SFT05538.1 Peroxiredoxin [Mucilaginibacter polytrichastri]